MHQGQLNAWLLLVHLDIPCNHLSRLPCLLSSLRPWRPWQQYQGWGLGWQLRRIWWCSVQLCDWARACATCSAAVAASVKYEAEGVGAGYQQPHAAIYPIEQLYAVECLSAESGFAQNRVSVCQHRLVGYALAPNDGWQRVHGRVCSQALITNSNPMGTSLLT